MPVRRRSWQRGAAVGVLGMGYTQLLSSRTHHNSSRRKRHHRKHHNKDTVVASSVDNPTTVEPQGQQEPMRKEVSVCLRSMSPGHQTTSMSRAATDSQLPLRVVLPPEKMADNKSSRLLTLDKDCNKKLIDSETTDDNNKTLNVEEFECGVSVAGSDKQEWSFTLYDFDGKGKITKEDLGSLLRSLYDAVGSSINLPKSGSKTLKLRLTVSPDTSKVAAGGTSRQTTETHSSSSKDKNNKTKESKLNKDLDNSKLSGKDLKLDNINNRTEQLHLESVSGGAAQEVKVHHKEVKNNLSNPGKPVTGKHKLLTTVEQRHLAELVQKNMERHQQRQQQRHHQRARRDHRKHHSFNAGGANNISSTNNRTTIHTCEESRDRRNYYLDLAGIENDDPTKLLHNTSAPADLLSPRLGKRDRDHRTRDGKLRARSSHNARRQQHAADLQTSGAAVNGGCDVAHQRSRSYDVPAEHRCCPLTAEEELAAEVAAHRTRVIERAVEEKTEKCKAGGITGAGAGTTTTTITSSPDSPPGTSPTTATLTSPPQNASTPNKNHQHKLLRPVSLPPNVPDSVSPHHHRRHRNRDRNRKLAMQQVAEWIEREHAWNAAAAAAANGGAGEKTATGSGAAAPGGTGNGASGGVGSAAGAAEQHQRVIVQRHEHHHVHEHHHHHHYHHYHET